MTIAMRDAYGEALHLRPLQHGLRRGQLVGNPLPVAEAHRLLLPGQGQVRPRCPPPTRWTVRITWNELGDVLREVCLQGAEARCRRKTPGVEMSTGSLSQGVSAGIGMASSQRCQCVNTQADAKRTGPARGPVPYMPHATLLMSSPAGGSSFNVLRSPHVDSQLNGLHVDTNLSDQREGVGPEDFQFMNNTFLDMKKEEDGHTIFGADLHLNRNARGVRGAGRVEPYQQAVDVHESPSFSAGFSIPSPSAPGRPGRWGP